MEGSNRPFLCAIVDEASNCSELESLSLLGLGISKLIMVGDASQPSHSQVIPDPTVSYNFVLNIPYLISFNSKAL